MFKPKKSPGCRDLFRLKVEATVLFVRGNGEENSAWLSHILDGAKGAQRGLVSRVVFVLEYIPH